MNEILKIAAEYEIPVIEDAAEALGSAYFEKKTGTFGEISILSFNGNKIITTSGGGAVVSKNKKYTDAAKFLATQARDEAPYYQHSRIGYNYRMSNICAGIGRGQMTVLNEWVLKRRQVFKNYKNALENVPGISFQNEPTEFYSNRWLTTIILNEKQTPNNITNDDVRFGLQSENIESRPLWKPMHLQPVFKDAPYYGSDISDDFFQKGLCLPSGSNITEQELNRVIKKVLYLFN